MDLQPIVSAPCAHCKEQILVNVDGKNCPQCGLAIHRRHAKAHRAECANKPMVERVARDYDEVSPFVFTRSLVAFLCISAFLLAFGASWLLAQEPEEPSRNHVALTWGAMGAGLVSLVGGFVYERKQQKAVTQRS